MRKWESGWNSSKYEKGVENDYSWNWWWWWCCCFVFRLSVEAKFGGGFWPAPLLLKNPPPTMGSFGVKPPPLIWYCEDESGGGGGTMNILGGKLPDMPYGEASFPAITIIIISLSYWYQQCVLFFAIYMYITRNMALTLKITRIVDKNLMSKQLLKKQSLETKQQQ